MKGLNFNKIKNAVTNIIFALIVSAIFFSILLKNTYAVNDITQSPLIVDTAATAYPVNRNIVVVSGVWVGVTTEAHTLIITDGADRTICSLLAPASPANLIIPVDFPGKYKGLKVATIDSGTLYLYYK